MKRCKSNKYLVLASFSGFILFFIGHFIKLPDILEGFCVGICIALYPIGIYTLQHDAGKIQKFKRNLFSRAK